MLARRVLVCGSRTWDDEYGVNIVLNGLYLAHCDYYLNIVGSDEKLTIIEGGAKGADKFAGEWAESEAPYVLHEQYPANWDLHGKAAGHIRNQQMLDEGKPDVVYAFSDNLSESKGTANMVERAKKAGLPVYVIGRV